MGDGRALAVADAVVSQLYDVRKGKLNLSTLRTAVDIFSKVKTGLGWPVFSSDRAHLDLVTEMSARIIRGGYPRESVHYYPGVVGFRGQPRSGPFCKFRAIYQGSRVIGNLEKMVQEPLLRALRGNPIFCAWAGRTAVDAEVTRLLRTTKHPLCSVDFSNFDASIPEAVIRRVFEIMKQWFHRSWHTHLTYLCDVFCGCGIYTPNGFYEGETRQGGIPSGSVLTNLIGSLVNLWVMNYASAVCKGRVLDCLVQGDDGVYRMTGCSSTKVADVLLSEFGMILSVEKSFVSAKEVHYLQNVHHTGFHRDGVCVGVRPLARVLNGMMSYEDVNRKWDKLYDSFRWLQQLENASEHPAFRQACQWLVERDPMMPEAVMAVLTNNRDLLASVRAALSGKYEWAKIAVDGIGTSRSFQTVTSILSGRKPVCS